jgi:hypothetical protein
MAWSGVVSKIVLAAIIFGVAYIALGYFGHLPQSMKDFVDFLNVNVDLWSFLFCFAIGAYVCLRIFGAHRSKGSGGD